MKKTIAIFASIAFIAFIALTAGSCSQSKSTRVDMYGVAFDCPAGWKITDTSDMKKAAYITIEKDGFGSNGLVTVVLRDQVPQLSDFLEFNQNSLREQENLANIEFGDSREAVYGKYKGIASSYSSKNMSLTDQGNIYIFDAKGKTICVIEEEAAEDHDRNQRGFKDIMNSFTVN